MVTCPDCGKQNPEERTFCQFCGTRLDSSIPPETHDRTEPAKTKDEVLQELHQQWESAKRELGHSAEQLAASERQVEALRQQLKAAEQKQPEEALTAKERLIAELKQKVEHAEREAKQLAAKLTAQDQQSPSTPEQQKPDGRWRFSPLALILGGFVLASAGTFGGFKAGTHLPDNSQTKLQLEAELQKEEALVKERAAQDRKLQDLQHALDSAGQGGKQLAEELAAKVQAAQKLSGTVQKLQSDLTVARADLAAARTEVEAKARAEQQLGQNLKQSTQQLLATNSKLTALQQIVQRHPSWNYSGPAEGFILWEGDVRNDKSIVVTLDHGKVRVDGNAGSSRLSGNLPGVACAVQPISKNVFIGTAPSATNGWMKIVLRVEGKGRVSARVGWTVL